MERGKRRKKKIKLKSSSVTARAPSPTLPRAPPPPTLCEKIAELESKGGKVGGGRRATSGRE